MESWIKIAVFALLLIMVSSKSMRHLLNEYHHENESSSNTTSTCNCDWRLLRHYEAKRCQPVQEDECGCPERYNCPSINEIENLEKVCIFKGKEYEVGSHINTTNTCQICKCLGRKNPRIFCIPIECPFLEHQDNGHCRPIYEKNICCPVRYECALLRTEDKVLLEAEFTCEYKSKYYSLGEKIYPEDNPCQICECTEYWNATNLQTCHEQDCVLEKNKAQLDAGCVPIYHESRCCPIEFYCPHNEDRSSYRTDGNISNEDYSAIGSQCTFGTNFYDVGQQLAINHTTKCVKCTCNVPPDFTCVHQSCPEPPHSENCVTLYSPDECCPRYECLLGDDSFDASPHTDVESALENEEMKDENPCFDMRCDEGRMCMLYLVMCGSETCPPLPTCLKINNGCEISTCGEGCVVIDQDENNCLTCACGENINRSVSALKCQTPHCVGQNCHLVAGEGGCPTCACDAPCAVNECPPGCNVLLSEVEGRCPKCICEDETEGCPTPLCQDETCRIESPEGGCPTCICDGRVNETSSTPQVQYQQRQSEDSAENESPNARESEEDFDDLRIMSPQNDDGQPDNELNSAAENAPDIRIVPITQAGERQP